MRKCLRYVVLYDYTWENLLLMFRIVYAMSTSLYFLHNVIKFKAVLDLNSSTFSCLYKKHYTKYNIKTQVELMF